MTDPENPTAPPPTPSTEHLAFKCVAASTQIINTVLFLVFVGISGNYFAKYS